MLLELLAERKTVRVPQLKGQLLQRQIAAQQQRLGAVHPDANGVLADGDSGGSPELLSQGFVAQVHLGGNLLSGDPPGVALHETAGQPDAVVLLPGAGAAGGDGAQSGSGLQNTDGSGPVPRRSAWRTGGSWRREESLPGHPPHSSSQGGQTSSPWSGDCDSSPR